MSFAYIECVALQYIFGILTKLTMATKKTTSASPKSARPAIKAKPAKSVQADETFKAPKKGVRVIKKYPNRRLYDTDTSAYITLTEVKRLVMKSEPFKVVDVKTNDDLTRSILLQIILEEESGGAPMFTEAVLGNIIRIYGNAMQGFMGSYLEKNVQAFTDVQSKMKEQAKDLSPEAWTKYMSPQNPLMQGMMGTVMAQMQKQTEAMLSAFGLKPK
jgi:polyhydroxyalkanoate synthesis repressor PhaR